MSDPYWGRHDELALGVVQLLVQFYELLDVQSTFLTASARSDILGIGQTLANLYMQLSIWSYNKRLKLWKLSPKLHLWEHLTEDQAPAGLNPRE